MQRAGNIKVFTESDLELNLDVCSTSQCSNSLNSSEL
jgi:hypothetical protein